jgi:hypothetical protein
MIGLEIVSHSPVSISAAPVSPKSKRVSLIVADKTLLYLPEVLKVRMQELFPRGWAVSYRMAFFIKCSCPAIHALLRGWLIK